LPDIVSGDGKDDRSAGINARDKEAAADADNFMKVYNDASLSTSMIASSAPIYARTAYARMARYARLSSDPPPSLVPGLSLKDGKPTEDDIVPMDEPAVKSRIRPARLDRYKNWEEFGMGARYPDVRAHRGAPRSAFHEILPVSAMDEPINSKNTVLRTHIPVDHTKNWQDFGMGSRYPDIRNRRATAPLTFDENTPWNASGGKPPQPVPVQVQPREDVERETSSKYSRPLLATTPKPFDESTAYNGVRRLAPTRPRENNGASGERLTNYITNYGSYQDPRGFPVMEPPGFPQEPRGYPIQDVQRDPSGFRTTNGAPERPDEKPYGEDRGLRIARNEGPGRSPHPIRQRDELPGRSPSSRRQRDEGPGRSPHPRRQRDEEPARSPHPRRQRDEEAARSPHPRRQRDEEPARSPHPRRQRDEEPARSPHPRRQRDEGPIRSPRRDKSAKAVPTMDAIDRDPSGYFQKTTKRGTDPPAIRPNTGMHPKIRYRKKQ
jgi:hypothetical protein